MKDRPVTRARPSSTSWPVGRRTTSRSLESSPKSRRVSLTPASPTRACSSLFFPERVPGTGILAGDAGKGPLWSEQTAPRPPSLKGWRSLRADDGWTPDQALSYVCLAGSPVYPGSLSRRSSDMHLSYLTVQTFISFLQLSLGNYLPGHGRPWPPGSLRLVFRLLS